jgi:phenylpropionate dioxygenase-like ring-hydroxylating dioxygenase large terminal subunit
LTFEIGGESILVVRQPSGAIAARYNVCKHRGNRLREPGMGHADSFSCVFHGWEYGSTARSCASPTRAASRRERRASAST